MKNKSIILLEAAMDKQIKISSEYSNRVSALAPSSVKLLAELGTQVNEMQLPQQKGDEG